MNRSDVILFSILLATALLAQIGLGVLLFNEEGVAWLRGLGWGLLAAASLCLFVPVATLRAWGGAPRGKPYYATTRLVQGGVYNLVRHPQQLGGILASLGLALIAQHWVVTVLGLVAVGLYQCTALCEDASCVRRWGPRYTLYMDRVPRLNIIQGLILALRRRASQTDR